jgi:hypothetical protein
VEGLRRLERTKFKLSELEVNFRTEMRREIMKKIQQLSSKHVTKKNNVKEQKEEVGQLEQYMQKRQTELRNKQNIRSSKKPRMADTSLVNLKSKIVSDPKKPKKKKFKVMK